MPSFIRIEVALRAKRPTPKSLLLGWDAMALRAKFVADELSADGV